MENSQFPCAFVLPLENRSLSCPGASLDLMILLYSIPHYVGYVCSVLCVCMYLEPVVGACSGSL